MKEKKSRKNRIIEYRRRYKASHAFVILILNEIKKEEYSMREISNTLNLSYKTVTAFCRLAYESHLLYISSWRQDAAGRRKIRIYGIKINDDQIDAPTGRGKGIKSDYRKAISLSQRSTPALLNQLFLQNSLRGKKEIE